MKSPNAAGRPRGIVDKRTKVTQALLDDAPAVTRVVIDAALEGDMQACNIVLSRIAPALKGQVERVQFPFDATAPIPQQIEAVLTAISVGAVSADVGQMIIGSLGVLSDARIASDLEARVTIIEGKQLA